MHRLARNVLVFTLTASIGWFLFAALTRARMPEPRIPAFHLFQPEITEISLEADFSACRFDHCPRSYKLVFAPNAPTGSAQASLFGGKEIGVQGGMIQWDDFDKLAELLDSEDFFAWTGDNTGCNDCLITSVSAVRDGQRKTVSYINGNAPLKFWTVQRAIEGTATQVSWYGNKPGLQVGPGVVGQ